VRNEFEGLMLQQSVGGGGVAAVPIPALQLLPPGVDAAGHTVGESLALLAASTAATCCLALVVTAVVVRLRWL